LHTVYRYAEDDKDSDEEDDYLGSGDSDEPTAKRPKPDSDNTDRDENRKKLLSHFNDVKLPLEDCKDWQTLFAQFDQPDKIACMIVELHAGEMLYLPASWFHEVVFSVNREKIFYIR